MTFMLETRDLTIRFGGHFAVNRVSCTFRPGELTAIVGPNGAGKTTYFNLISGQLRPTEGSILLDGADITQLSAPLRTRAGLGRAFQLTNLFPNLSVEENVRLAVQSESGVHYDMLRPWMTRRDLIARADAILDKVALGNRRSVPATALSHGDQRKLEVALMMALEPKVFMFDEPTAGMSIDEVPVVLNLIAKLKQDASKIILLVEHKMDVVRSLADRIIVLHNGQLVADGKPAEVIPRRSCRRPISASRPERARHDRPSHPRRRAHPHWALSHPARTRFRRARRPDHHAAWPQRRRQEHNPANHHGPVAGILGADIAGRAIHRAKPDPGYRPARRRLCPREHGGVFRSDREGKSDPCGARRTARRHASGVDFRLLPRAQAFLAVARRRAVRRTEADAFHCPRYRRTAQAVADRRAHQGPGAGDRGGADRMLRGGQTPRRHDPAGRTEFPRRARARRQRSGDG